MCPQSLHGFCFWAIPPGTSLHPLSPSPLSRFLPSLFKSITRVKFHTGSGESFTLDLAHRWAKACLWRTVGQKQRPMDSSWTPRLLHSHTRGPPAEEVHALPVPSWLLLSAGNPRGYLLSPQPLSSDSGSMLYSGTAAHMLGSGIRQEEQRAQNRRSRPPKIASSGLPKIEVPLLIRRQ